MKMTVGSSADVMGQAMLKAARRIIEKNPDLADKILGPDTDILNTKPYSLERRERRSKEECKNPYICQKFQDGECDAVPSSLCLE